MDDYLEEFVHSTRSGLSEGMLNKIENPTGFEEAASESGMDAMLTKLLYASLMEMGPR